MRIVSKKRYSVYEISPERDKIKTSEGKFCFKKKFFFFTLSLFGSVENFYTRELSIVLALKKDTMFFHQVTITSKKGEWLLASK